MSKEGPNPSFLCEAEQARLAQYLFHSAVVCEHLCLRSIAANMFRHCSLSAIHGPKTETRNLISKSWTFMGVFARFNFESVKMLEPHKPIKTRQLNCQSSSGCEQKDRSNPLRTNCKRGMVGNAFSVMSFRVLTLSLQRGLPWRLTVNASQQKVFPTQPLLDNSGYPEDEPKKA